MNTIRIQPSVFEWICKSSGWTPTEIAENLSRPVELVNSWYNGDSAPHVSISELNVLSEGFKRPLTAFLLSTPPKDERIPEDFRKVVGPHNTFSKETFQMIRRARRTLRLWKELSDSIGESTEVSLPLYHIDQNPEEIAQKERERLNILHPLPWKDEYMAYRFYREVFFQLRILVLQLNMPIEEARGFSIVEDGCAAIVVNGKDSVRARIFTILHEYAHILLNEHAVCNDESDASSDLHAVSVEHWCNMFAGAFLLPKAELERNNAICEHIAGHQYEKAVDKIASYFKVSRDAALIRLRALNIISESELFEIRNQILSHVTPPKEKSFKPVSKEEICLRENGEQFVSLVLKCENVGQITYYDALDYLDVKSFDFLKSLVSQT